jgi:hypothetical protein
VRAPGAILSTAGLLLGFLQAPFFHIHAEDLDHAPTSTLLHVHLHRAREASGPVIAPHTADDDAIDVGWNLLRPTIVSLAFNFVASEAVGVPLPAPTSAATPVPDRRGHDPPGLKPKQPRAPPA